MVTAREIKAKVELNAIEARFVLDSLYAYERVCNKETKNDCRTMRMKIRDAFGKKAVYLH